MKRPPCPCPACRGDVYRPWRRMRHTLVDRLRPRLGDCHGHLYDTLYWTVAADQEAREAWTRLR